MISGASIIVSLTKVNPQFLLFFMALRFLRLLRTKLSYSQSCLVLTLDDSGHPFPYFPHMTNTYLDNFDISSKKFAAVIAQLDPSKATGPDGIPVVVLQKCSPELSPVLSKLYPKCVSESCFPSCWEFPSVIPVFKNSGERSDPRNYRHISLLPIISKVFESLINRCLVNHLDSNNLFSDFQYGFRSGRSTADVLTVISECVYRALDACGETRATV